MSSVNSGDTCVLTKSGNDVRVSAGKRMEVPASVLEPGASKEEVACNGN